MSGSGGGDTEIKDTPEQKALAEVGAEEWNYAQETLAPLQDMYMEQVDSLDSQERKDYISGNANIGMQNAIGHAGTELVSAGTANGLDLNSGKFKTALSDSMTETAAIGGDTAARGLIEQDKQKVMGLQNVVAIGSGQETQAIAGMADIADLSAQKAGNDAYNAFNRRSANLQTVGRIVGAGTSYYMNNQGAPVKASQMRMQDGGGAIANNGNNWEDF